MREGSVFRIERDERGGAGTDAHDIAFRGEFVEGDGFGGRWRLQREREGRARLLRVGDVPDETEGAFDGSPEFLFAKRFREKRVTAGGEAFVAVEVVGARGDGDDLERGVLRFRAQTARSFEAVDAAGQAEIHQHAWERR